jgi:hypothetical protein
MNLLVLPRSSKQARQRIRAAAGRQLWTMSKPMSPRGARKMGGAEFKQEMRSGKVKLGLFVNSASMTVAEQLAHSGYDWLLIDTQHGPMVSASAVHGVCMACAPQARRRKARRDCLAVGRRVEGGMHAFVHLHKGMEPGVWRVGRPGRGSRQGRAVWTSVSWSPNRMCSLAMLRLPLAASRLDRSR